MGGGRKEDRPMNVQKKKIPCDRARVVAQRYGVCLAQLETFGLIPSAGDRRNNPTNLSSGQNRKRGALECTVGTWSRSRIAGTRNKEQV